MKRLIVLTLASLLPLASADAPAVGRHYREVHELTTMNFEKAQEPGSAWLVLFYAPWCGHCKKLAPAYEKVATHYHRASPQRVHVGRIDATQHAGLATQYEIKGYPTLILLRGGERVADYTGARTFEALVDFVDETLALPPGAPRSPSARKAAAPTRTKKKSVGAAAYYLYGKESLVWLFTEADSMTFAFAALATVVSFGVGLVVVLVAATTPSPR